MIISKLSQCKNHGKSFSLTKIVGFSIGALIAQHYTEKNYKKVNKLVLIGSVYKRTEEQIKTVKNRFKNALNGREYYNRFN